MSLKDLGTYAAGAGALCLLGGGIVFLAQPAPGGWLLAVLLAGALLLLLAAYAHFGAIARRLARRQTKYGLNVLAMVVLLLAIIGFVEYLSVNYYHGRLDLTEGKRYTLSPQTVKVLKDLTRPVKAVAFYRAGGGGGSEDRRGAEDLLRQLADLSSNFRYEFVDPDRDPGMARRYKITLYGTVVLETPEDGAGPVPAPPAAKAAEQKAGTAAEGPAAKKTGPSPPVAERAMREEQISEPTEEKITNALVKLTRPGRRTVYFVQGHGEGNISDTGRTGFGLLRQEVDKANYVTKDLLFPRDKTVPDDAAVVVILGPQKDLSPEELEQLDAYIQRGGKLLALADPTLAPGLKPFLAKYGLKLADDLVLSRQFPLGGGPETPVVNTYPEHPITRGLQGTITVFSLVRSVDAAAPPPEGARVEKLVETPAFPISWAQPDNRRTVSFDERTDRKGPVPIAAVAIIEQKKPAPDPAKAGKPAKKAEGQKAGAEDREPGARLVVFGNSRFASNLLLGLGGNRDLVMNTISWLAEEEGLIAIRPKDPKSSPLFLTAAQGRLFWAIPVVFMPLAVAGAGLWVFVKRRQAR